MSDVFQLTSIEKYYLYDECPAFPNNFLCWLRFHGQLDHEAAQKALEQTIERHPLSSVKVQPDQRERLCWIKNLEPLEFESIDAGTDEIQIGRINPFTDNTMKLWKVRTREGWDIIFQGHHAAVDGKGGLQLVSDWMVAYSMLTGNQNARLYRLNPTLLSRRNRLDLLKWDFVSKLYSQPLAIIGAMRFLFRKVAPLVPDAPQLTAVDIAQIYDGYPKFKRRTMSVTSFSQLQAAAASKDSTVHALLMRDLFLTIHGWRKEFGFSQPGERIRLMIPMSIRNIGDRRLPAANRATMVQIDRRIKVLDDPDYLLEMINDELQFIRRNKLEKTFLIFVRCFSLFPQLMQRMCRSEKCRATTALTNLGAPFERLNLPYENGKIKIGGLRLDDFDLIVPLRRHTPAVFAVARYAGKLTITMQYDPRLVPEENAERLIESFINHLQKSAGVDNATIPSTG